MPFSTSGNIRLHRWLNSKESTCNTRDAGSVPGLGRCPGERNGNPLQYSCLENSKDREPGGLQSLGSQKSDMTERLTHALEFKYTINVKF